MQYNGGKGKIARELAWVISSFKPNIYWEPFVGAANVIQHIKAPYRIGSDLDLHIVHYLSLIQKGWNPPNLTIDESLYLAWKKFEPSKPEEYAIKAMIGYGCSFGGKWFGGFARVPRKDSSNSFYQTAQIASRKQFALLKGIMFFQQSFLDFTPIGTDLIYCDPPYRNTTHCGTNRKFDSDLFWAWCLRCNLQGIRVLVTEFEAPSFAHEIWRKTKAADLKQNGTTHTERLFLVGET